MLNRAAYLEMDKVDNSETGCYTSSTLNLSLFTVVVSEVIPAKYSQMDSWERRTKRGEALGHNTLGTYMACIMEGFAGGCNEKGSKMSAVQMKEALLSKYLRRYDITIEYHVNAEISRIRSAGRVRPYGMDSEDGVTKAAQSRGMQSDYAHCIRHMVEKNYAIKPREARALLFATLGLSEDTLPGVFTTDAWIRSNISAVKTAIRKS